MSETCAKCGKAGDVQVAPEYPEYAGLCAFCAMQKWFMLSGGEYWNAVECIACELGRQCDTHGKTGDEP